MLDVACDMLKQKIPWIISEKIYSTVGIPNHAGSTIASSTALNGSIRPIMITLLVSLNNAMIV